MATTSKHLSSTLIIGISVLLAGCESTSTKAPESKIQTAEATDVQMSALSTCDSPPFDPKGKTKFLKAALQNATNTGKPVVLSGTYYIDKEITIHLRNNLVVDARRAKFIATSQLDGDMFGLDAHSTMSLQCGARSMMNIMWVGGEMNMADAKVSQVVPIKKLTPEGRTGQKNTADALSIRAYRLGLQKVNHVHIEGIKVVGTKNDTDPFYLAGGDSGILMSGPKSAKITRNQFYGIRDAAIYVTAAGDNGEIGDDFELSYNTIERAYDGITSKRGADRVKMHHNQITDTAVGLSIKHLASGRVSHDIEMTDNLVSRSGRAISLEGVKNVKVTRNQFLEIGEIFGGNPNPYNARGKHYEAIGLDGTQGEIIIQNNVFEGVIGERAAKTKTYGIVSRPYDGKQTTKYNSKNNTFNNLDENEVQEK